MNPREIPKDDAQLGAIRWAKKIAEEILRGAWGVKGEIVDLFTVQQIPASEIAKRMEGKIGWKESASQETKSNIILQVIRSAVEEEVRVRINEHRRQETATGTLKRNHNKVSAARDAWMKEQGYKVWSKEEKEYFIQLMGNPAMRWTEKRLDHEKIAKAMNEKFETQYFTSLICQKYCARTKKVSQKGEK